MKKAATLLFLLVVLPIAACGAQLADMRHREPLSLVGADGAWHEFKVEVMRTPTELWTGLRYRKSMAANEGMLFDLGGEQIADFTMSDTLIPLDMLFIGQDGRVLDIDAMTVPGNPGPYKSKVPVVAVLELNAGTAAKLGIADGTLVRHPMFAAQTH